MNMKRELLPRAEWIFGDLPADQLHACLYFEYARTSDKIRRGIKQWRDAVPELPRIKAEWLTAPTTTWEPGSARHHDQAEFEEYIRREMEDRKANQSKPALLAGIDEALLGAVAAFPEFPKTPWNLIPDSPIKQTVAKDFKSTDKTTPTGALADHTANLALWHQSGISPWPMICKALNDPQNADIKATMHLIAISWNHSDAEILEAFNRWVGKNRPKQWPAPTGKRTYRGIGWQKLPAEHKTLLDALGVFRRHRKAGTWTNFVAHWTALKGQDDEQYLRSLKRARALAESMLKIIGGD